MQTVSDVQEDSLEEDIEVLTEDAQRKTDEKQAELIALYDGVQLGTVSEEEYFTALIETLENYIKCLISRKHRTVKAEFEDLMQSGKLAIIENARRYDPRYTKPTTFFTCYIDDEQKKCINTHGMKGIYEKEIPRLDKAAKEAGFTDMLDPRLDADTLCILTGMSLNTVIGALDVKKSTVVSLEAVTENCEPESKKYRSPEEAYIENEKCAFIREQFLKLSPFEQYLISKRILGEKECSFLSIFKELKEDDELRESFKDELPKSIDQKYLQQRTNGAIQKLKYLPEMNRFFEIKEDERIIDIYEQAEDADVEAAIKQNLLDL